MPPTSPSPARTGLVRTALVAAIVAGLAAPAYAAGGGNDDSTGGSKPTIKPCPAGQARNWWGKCVDKSSNLLDEESRYAYGAWLAQTGRYGEAIELLSLAENKDEPRVLNYLGYAHRQLGRFEVGLGYYRQALAADPNYVRAREYLGEAYLVMGKPDLAREQLGEIAARCGTDCEEYRLLADAIADHEKAARRS